ncbi:hypothetical protein I4U23_016565 [Adineta vaga]|nr:hypothetical protein I4U23_016565 [Adineta vaga]
MSVTGQSCKAKVYDSSDKCNGRLSIRNPCNSATLHLGATNLKSCTDVNLSWDYPTSNLTIVIETPFTQRRQPYAVNLKDHCEFDCKMYRILDETVKKLN